MFYKLFKSVAEKHADQTALISGKRELSYGELLTRTNYLATYLKSQNINKGNVVLLVVPNGTGFIEWLLALFSLGVIVVPVNTKFPLEEIRYFAETSEASTVFFVKENNEKITELSNICKLIDINNIPDNVVSKAEEPDLNANSPAIYMFSSGSTGRPKRVMRTHGQLVAEYRSLRDTIELSEKDRILCTVPLFHAHGFGNCLTAALLSGAVLIFSEGEFNARDTLALIDKNRISIYPSVPFMLKMMADIFISDKPDLSCIRLVFSAGAALPEETQTKFAEKYGSIIRQLYGSTETGAVSINYNGNNSTNASVGLPLQGVTIDLIDESGIPIKQGDTGEVAIVSPAMTKQYDSLPEISAECFVGGYFLPGDLGNKDRNGNLFITGRKKLLINVAGNKVDPVDVEMVIQKHPKVKEVVVLGKEHPTYGEIVKAVVVSKEEAFDKAEIISLCETALAEYKVPKIVEFIDEIPRSPLGKILRKYL